MVLGFVAGMIAYNGGNGSGFLGAILAGYLSGLVVLGMQKLFVWMPDREFRGLKAIFLYPVIGVFTVGTAMWLLNTPMRILNTGLMDF